MGTTYTRQSSFSDGDTITAALFNNEYNQLLTAFSYASSGTTGHQHDGTTAEGGNIHTIGDQDFLNKIVADRTNNRWGVFVEVSSSAVEQVRFQDGVIVPVTDNDIDLGTSSVEFKDAYFDGTVTTDALVADTADINGGTVDGATIGASSATTGVFTTIQGSTITATTAFVPDASDGAALGTSSLEFSDLFLADGAVINFGDDQDVTLTHVADTGLLLSSTDQLQFGDSGTYIHQSADGVLDLVSDTEIELTATTIDINGAVAMDGAITGGTNITISGELDAATLDISGNADIDGTTNLDAVDIDGAVQIDATVTVGVDDTGYDVKFFGATASAYMLWDASTDDLVLAGAAGIDLAGDIDVDGTANLDVVDIDGAVDMASTLTLAGNADFNGDLDVDGTTNLDAVDIDGAVQIDGTVTVGVDDTGKDVKFFGATSGSYLLWDESADSLLLTDSTPVKIGDSQDMTLYHDGSNSYLTNSTGALKVATETSGIAVTIGHTTSETTVADNLTVTGNASIGGNLDVTGSFDMSDADITNIGSIALDTITNDGTDITLDSSGDIVLDAGGADIFFKDDGTTFGSATNTSGNLIIKSGTTTALTFSGANVTAAGTYTGGGTMTTGGNIVIPNAGNIGSASDTDAIAIASNGVVTFSQVPVLPDDTVATADIQDNAVTLAKMAGLARGKIIYGDSSGDPAALAVGSANYVLTSDGTDISWAAASGADPSSADGDSLGTASAEWSDLYLADGGIIYFGNDQEITLTHAADDGLILKHVGTGDGKEPSLTFQAGDNDIAANDVLGSIFFQAPDEGAGTDAVLVAAGVEAVSEGNFSASNNATKLSFKTAASEAAAEKMALSSVGILTLNGSSGSIVIPDGASIGSASDTDAITIASTGLITVTQDLTVADDVTIGDDLLLDSDSAIIKLGDDQDVTITHNADKGITLNSMDISGVKSINGTDSGSGANYGQIGGRRNMIYNGDMAIAQRATSSSGLGASSGYFVQDRWKILVSQLEGRFTLSQDAETPDGFANSMKIDCTTTDNAEANEYLIIEHKLEGLDLQGLNKGDAQARPLILSFWVRSPKTGVHTVNLYDTSNTRHIGSTYTIASADTWEYHSVTFAGDTSGVIPDDNTEGLTIYFWLMSGSNWTSGTFATSWASFTAANAVHSSQVNVLDNTNNDFYLTGVQMELGDTASAFEYQSYGENLARCQRYFYKGEDAIYGARVDTFAGYANVWFPTTMRADPTVTGVNSASTAQGVSRNRIDCYAQGGYPNFDAGHTASAEL